MKSPAPVLKHVLQYLLIAAGFVAMPFLLYAAVVMFGDVATEEREGQVSPTGELPPSPHPAVEELAADAGPINEFDDLEDASLLKRQDNGTYDLLTGLNWIADGVNENELDTVTILIELGKYEPGMAVDFTEMPWFQDDLTEYEAWAFNALSYYDTFAPDQLRKLPWVLDGIDAREAWALNGLAAVFDQAPGPADRLASRTWFRDGVNRDESDVLAALGAMSQETNSTNSIIWMPFLETIEETDALALRALYNLMTEDSQTGIGSYAVLYTNSVISDGITDNETIPIILAADTYAVNPDLADVLLDQSGTTIETSTIDLPLAGEVVLVIVRVQEGSPESMDSLAKSVAFAEDYMGEPFPANTVLLLFADAVRGDFAGHYAGSNITIHPDFDSDDAEEIIMHEVAHYYWHGSAHDWLDEGAAEFLSVRYLESEMGVNANEILAMGFLGEDSCDEIDTLSELEEPFVDTQTDSCSYELGLLFFLALRKAVGATDFQHGFQELYLSGSDTLEIDNSDARNIGHVPSSLRFQLRCNRRSHSEVVRREIGAANPSCAALAI